MSELTTSQLLSDYLWAVQNQMGPHEPGEQAREEKRFHNLLVRVQREAAVKALREAADAALAVREDHCGAWPWPGSPDWFEVAEEYEATKAAYEQLKESPWGWIVDRADRMEAGE